MSTLSRDPRTLPESRHDVLSKLASGGMATVYLGVPAGARDLVDVVALKRPHQHLVDDPGFRGVLVAEAGLASKLVHPNVVNVRALERVGDSYQLVMDWVEGASLGALLVRASKGGVRLPPSAAISIVRDAAAGLEALHELTGDDGRPLGFVHRDVSPQNLLVGVDGRARLTDFGLAKCARASDEPTTQGTLKGKLGYMAPEYVRGAGIDRRADVFALGVVLWEALAGKRLFRGDNDADTLDRVTRAPIPPISEAAEGVHPAFDAVVAKALARSADERWPTAGAFARALDEAAKTANVTPDPRAAAAHVQRELGPEISERRTALLRALEARREEKNVSTERPEPVQGSNAGEGSKPAGGTTSAAPRTTPDPTEQRGRRGVAALVSIAGALVVAAALAFSKQPSAPSAHVEPPARAEQPAGDAPSAARPGDTAAAATSTRATKPPPPGRLQREVNKWRTKVKSRPESNIDDKVKSLPPNPYGPSESPR